MSANSARVRYRLAAMAAAPMLLLALSSCSDNRESTPVADVTTIEPADDPAGPKVTEAPALVPETTQTTIVDIALLPPELPATEEPAPSDQSE